MKALLFLGLTILGTVLWNDEVWFSKLCLLLWLSSAWISYEVSRRTHWLVFIPLLWPLALSIWIAYSKEHHFLHLSMNDQLVVRELALDGALTLLAPVCMLVLMDKKYYRVIEEFLAWFCVGTSATALYQLFFVEYNVATAGGLLGNPSMNASFIAVTYPFLAFRPNKKEWFPLFQPLPEFILVFLMLTLPLAAITLTEANMGYGAIFVAVLAYTVARYKLKAMKVAFIIASTFLVAYWWRGESLFQTSGRWPIWAGAMEFWWEKDLW